MACIKCDSKTDDLVCEDCRWRNPYLKDPHPTPSSDKYPSRPSYSEMGVSYDYQVFPEHLSFTDRDIRECPICQTSLLRRERTARRCNECPPCRYADRPCGMYSTYYHDTPCTCTYYDVQEITIYCEKCMVIRCTRCTLDAFVRGDTCGYCEHLEYFHEQEKERERKRWFKEIWTRGTVKEKLSTYSIQKLKILASQKNVRGRSKMDRESLLNVLSRITTDKDLPIR